MLLIFHDISILSKTIQAQSQSVQISAIESVKHSKDVYIYIYTYNIHTQSTHMATHLYCGCFYLQPPNPFPRVGGW